MFFENTVKSFDIEENAMKKVIKILVLGERSVGKTTLLQKYCTKEKGIRRKVKHTIGCDMHIKLMENGKYLEFWELSGDKQY